MNVPPVIASVHKKPQQYSISMANALVANPDKFLGYSPGSKALIITTPTVGRIYGNFLAALARCFELSRQLILNVSEESKDFTSVEQVCTAAQESGLGRNDVFVVVSGGCCIDIVTTAASLFRRGVAVIRIPTTLIGAVDAGIGVKSSLNLAGRKSAVGLFHPPSQVWVDRHFLATLPLRHIRCGLAEILKMGLVHDRGIFDLLQRHQTHLASGSFLQSADSDIDLLLTLAIQAMIDELQPNIYEDQTFERKVDFGHTVSNALEAHSQWQIPHGYAVAIDMALSCYLAFRLGLISEAVLDSIVQLMLALKLPIYDRRLNLDVCNAGVEKALLHRGGELNLVVPTAIGQATFIKSPTPELQKIMQAGLIYLGQLQAGAEPDSTADPFIALEPST